MALPGKWWSAPQDTSAVANELSPSAWSPGGQPAYDDTFVEVVAAPAAANAPGGMHVRAVDGEPP